jgi:hypothetical protein
MLKTALLTWWGLVFSLSSAPVFDIRRSIAILRSRSVRKEHSPGLEGMKKGAASPIKQVNKPSKKKMLRHLEIIMDEMPQAGMRASLQV